MNRTILILTVMALSACIGSKNTQNHPYRALSDTAPFIIYKTKADYSNLVPIIMNDEKTVVLAYPDPADLRSMNGSWLPTLLRDGYLLDNKGIGINVVYTSYSGEAYSRLDEVPSLDELISCIIDKDPLLEMYDCKTHTGIKGDIKKMNQLIGKGFKGCKRIK